METLDTETSEIPNGQWTWRSWIRDNTTIFETDSFFMTIHSGAGTVESIQNFIRDRLLPCWRQHSQADWDGYAAMPVPKEAVFNTVRFLLSLPCDCPQPKVKAEPDGYMTLEWYPSRRKLILVSIGFESNVHYLAIDGALRVHGTEPIQDEATDAIVSLICETQTDSNS